MGRKTSAPWRCNIPAYQYRCANKHETTKFFRVRDYVEAVDCDRCDLAAVRIWTAPTVKVQPDIAYDSPIDGKPVTTHHARQEDLKRNNCVPYDPEFKKDVARKHQERTAQFEAAVEETVGREIAKMPKQKKERLINEVVHQGLTTEAVRMA